MNQQFCEHLRDPDRCLPCAFSELAGALSNLDRAVVAVRRTAVRSNPVSGGQRSWEPINLAAMSLDQDIVRQGGYLERQLRKVLNEPPLAEAGHSSDAVLFRLRNLLDRAPDSHQVTSAGRRLVLHWRDRARVILGQALAPYPLIAETVDAKDQVVGVKVKCPVVDPKVERLCGAQLLVYRVDDERNDSYGDVANVTCVRDDTHTWSQERGYLRLRLLVGELVAVAS